MHCKTTFTGLKAGSKQKLTSARNTNHPGSRIQSSKSQKRQTSVGAALNTPSRARDQALYNSAGSGNSHRNMAEQSRRKLQTRYQKYIASNTKSHQSSQHSPQAPQYEFSSVKATSSPAPPKCLEQEIPAAEEDEPINLVLSHQGLAQQH